MNDDFLHRVRVEPPPRFLADLKTRLDRQDCAPSAERRRSTLRGLLIGILLGGTGVAIAWVCTLGVPDWIHGLTGGPVPNAIRTNRPSWPAARLVDDVVRASASDAASAVSPPGATVSSSTLRPYLRVVGPLAFTSNAEDASRHLVVGGAPRLPEVAVVDTTKGLALLCNVPDAPGDEVHGNAVEAEVRARAPNVVLADRRMLRSELEACVRNGVPHVTEFNAGYEAIAIVRSRLYSAPNRSARDVFLALGAQVPDPAHPESLVKNPYTYWNQVDPELEVQPIDVVGPPLSSAIGTAAVDLLVEAGCRTFPWLAALEVSDERRYDAVCKSVRADGLYGESADKAILEHLQANPNAIGVVGFRYVGSRPDTLIAGSIEGVEPTLGAVSAGKYPASRALYLYANGTRAAGPLNTDFIRGFVLAYLDTVGGAADTSALLPPDEAQRRRNIHDAYLLPDVKL